ncbi:MAG: transposase [Pirellulales bacterium]
MSRSLKRVLQEALQVSRRVLRRFSNRFSPHKFTQPQLFACLVMKEFLGQDYRTAFLAMPTKPDLQKWIGLARPHYKTLHKASQRLLRADATRRLLQAELARGRRLGLLRPRVETAAIDGTGLLAQAASHHFRARPTRSENAGKHRPRRATRRRRWPKLMVACDCGSHLIVAMHVERGPASDTRRFLPLACDLYDEARPRVLVCDAGFDAEWIHTACRDLLDIRSLIPPRAADAAADRRVGSAVAGWPAICNKPATMLARKSKPSSAC